MKKTLLLILMLFANFSLFAQNRTNGFVYFPPVPGTSSSPTDNAIITRMLINELYAHNYVPLDSPHGADFFLYGTLSPYDEYYQSYTMRDETPATTTYTYNAAQRAYNRWEPWYMFQIVLKNVSADETILRQNVTFTDINDLYNYFPLLIYNIFNHIDDRTTSSRQTAGRQGSSRQDSGRQGSSRQGSTRQGSGRQSGGQSSEDETWRNKWFYIRASFDFPISFFILQPDGLIAGTGAYSGDFDDPDRVQHLDNRVFALPAATLGFELQFLNWWSIEPIMRASWESLNDADYFNLEAGVEVKFPLKFLSSIMLEPYAAVSFPIPLPGNDAIFASTPLLAVGGGLQFGMKGGKSGSFFVDINYMYYIGKAGVYNPYEDLNPNPPIINYQRSVIGIGAGYKIGMGNR